MKYKSMIYCVHANGNAKCDPCDCHHDCGCRESMCPSAEDDNDSVRFQRYHCPVNCDCRSIEKPWDAQTKLNPSLPGYKLTSAQVKDGQVVLSWEKE